LAINRFLHGDVNGVFSTNTCTINCRTSLNNVLQDHESNNIVMNVTHDCYLQRRELIRIVDTILHSHVLSIGANVFKNFYSIYRILLN